MPERVSVLDGVDKAEVVGASREREELVTVSFGRGETGGGAGAWLPRVSGCWPAGSGVTRLFLSLSVFRSLSC